MNFTLDASEKISKFLVDPNSLREVLTYCSYVMKFPRGVSNLSLCENSPYMEFFRFVFSRIRTDVFCPSAVKYGTEDFQIQALSKQCISWVEFNKH